MSNQYLVSSGNYSDVLFHSFDTGKVVYDVSGNDSEVNIILPIHGSKNIVTSSYDYMIRLFKMEKHVSFKEMKGHDGIITSLASDDVVLLFSASHDCTFRVWNITKDTGLCSRKIDTPRILSLKYFNKKVYGGTSSGEIVVFDGEKHFDVVDTNDNCPGLLGVNCIEIDQKRQILFTGGMNKFVRIWSLKNVKDVASDIQFQHEIEQIHHVPDTENIIVSNRNHDIYCYDTRKLNKPVWFFEKFHNDRISDIVSVYQSNQRSVYTSSHDSTIKKILLKNGKSSVAYQGEKNDDDQVKIHSLGILKSNRTLKKPASVSREQEMVEFQKKMQLDILRQSLQFSAESNRRTEELLSTERKMRIELEEQMEKLLQELHTKNEKLQSLEDEILEYAIFGVSEKSQKTVVTCEGVKLSNDDGPSEAVEEIRKKMEKEKKSEIEEKIKEMKHRLEEKTKKLNEMKDIMKQQEEERKVEEEKRKKKKKKGLGGSLIGSLVKVPKSRPNSSFIGINIPFSAPDRIGQVEMEKSKLEEEIKRLGRVNHILTSPDLVSFVYGNNSKDVLVRGYLGFVVKQSEVNDSSRNEIRFFEELEGKIGPIGSDDNDSAHNMLFSKRFFEKELDQEVRNRYFPKYYGHWETKDKRFFKFIIEKGKCLPTYYEKNFPSHRSDHPKKILGLMLEVARALNILHQNQLVHGDVKVDNIVVVDHQPKLLDFEGVRGVSEPLPSDGFVSGTFNFVDPKFHCEILSLSATTDPYLQQRDLFSLTLVLVFMLTRQRPFSVLIREIILKIFDPLMSMYDFPRLLYRCVNMDNSDYQNHGRKFLEDLGAKRKEYPVVDRMFKCIEECKKLQSYFPLIMIKGSKSNDDDDGNSGKKKQKHKNAMDTISEDLKKLLVRGLSFEEATRPSCEEIIMTLEKELDVNEIKPSSSPPKEEEKEETEGEEEEEDQNKSSSALEPEKKVEEEKNISNESPKSEPQPQQKEEKQEEEEDEDEEDEEDDVEFKHYKADQPKTKIDKVDVKQWKKKMVKEWLSYVFFKDGRDFTAYAKNFRNMTGKKLMLITTIEHVSKNLGVRDESDQKQVLKAVEDLRYCRKYVYGERVVFQKLDRMARNFPKYRSSNLLYLSQCLSDPKEMKKTYLNMNILEEHMNEYIEDEEITFDSDEEEEEKEKKDDNNTPVTQIITEDLSDQKREKFKLPIKLVVTEIIQHSGQKRLRRLLSPVLSKIPTLNKEFGIFHTAVIVGPWYIEWNNSSLVIPRKLYSDMALISADMDTMDLIRNSTIEEVMDKIAKFVVKWNTTKVYANMNVQNKPDYGNCQDFVDALFDELGIRLNKKGAFGKFLQAMKENGTCKMEFYPNEKFRMEYNLTLKKYVFDTHEELDTLVIGLEETNNVGFEFDYKEERRLLKSFDRAMWLRHFKKPELEKFKPSRFGCPFDDPRDTKSYMVYRTK